jgi:hypothetical protein
VSVDLNNQAKDANIIMTQNKQLLLHPNPTNPSKKKTQIPLPVCNMQPYIPKDFGDIKVGHFKTEK